MDTRIHVHVHIASKINYTDVSNILRNMNNYNYLEYNVSNMADWYIIIIILFEKNEYVLLYSTV